MANHRQLLERWGACTDGAEWYDGQDSYKAWRACKRGDWMLWVAGRLDIDRKLLVLAACDCAALALRYVEDGEDRPRMAIETARAWCRGEATLDDVGATAHAAHASYAAAYATAYATAHASYATAHATAHASYAAAHATAHATASAAAHAAYATADATASAAARRKTLARCATIARRRIPWSVVRDRLAALAAGGGESMPGHVADVTRLLPDHNDGGPDECA